VTGSEFTRKLRKLARANGTDCRVESNRGKGGHQTIYYGDRRTTIPDLKKEIKPGLLNGLCRQLGIDKDDL